MSLCIDECIPHSCSCSGGGLSAFSLFTPTIINEVSEPAFHIPLRTDVSILGPTCSWVLVVF